MDPFDPPVHPSYGPCDAFGPDGTCSECTGLLNSEHEREVRLRDAFEKGYDAFEVEPNDGLASCFALQSGFMEMLRADGRFPDWPMKLSSKEEQRKLQGFLWDTVRELSEASATLKNRPHRVLEEEFDRAHFLEEMGDAWAFFMEVLILAGFGPDNLYAEYRRKNKIVRDALIKKER